MTAPRAGTASCPWELRGDDRELDAPGDPDNEKVGHARRPWRQP